MQTSITRDETHQTFITLSGLLKDKSRWFLPKFISAVKNHLKVIEETALDFNEQKLSLIEWDTENRSRIKESYAKKTSDGVTIRRTVNIKDVDGNEIEAFRHEYDPESEILCWAAIEEHNREFDFRLKKINEYGNESICFDFYGFPQELIPFWNDTRPESKIPEIDRKNRLTQPEMNAILFFAISDEVKTEN